MPKSKSVIEILVKFGCKVNKTGKVHDDYITQAQRELWEIIDKETPCTSSTLKLNAKEKFIWLSGIKDYLAKLKEMLTNSEAHNG